MPRSLSIANVLQMEADVLVKAREKARLAHPTDIRAAGNEVEEAVRSFLRRFLPPRYYVTSGHLIDSNQVVSPQIDVIIADHFTLPSLFTTQDGTEYVPITSVLAIGEVKSTYYHAQGYYGKFKRDMADIAGMERPLIENTAFDGFKDHTLVRDMVRESSNRYYNNLYTFFLCIDGGDFRFDKIAGILNSSKTELLPNFTCFLNRGVVAYGDRNNPGAVHKYPEQVECQDYDWCFMQSHQESENSMSGGHLALLYGQLVNHLTHSYLEPPDIYSYMKRLMTMRASSLMWAREQNI